MFTFIRAVFGDRDQPIDSVEIVVYDGRVDCEYGAGEHLGRIPKPPPSTSNLAVLIVVVPATVTDLHTDRTQAHVSCLRR